MSLITNQTPKLNSQVHQQIRQRINLYVRVKLSPAKFPIRDSIIAGIDTKAGIKQDGG